MSLENGHTHDKYHLMHILEIVSNGLDLKNEIIEPKDHYRINISHECENFNDYVSKGFKKCHQSAKFAYLRRLVRHGCTDGILDILEHSTDDFSKIKNHVGTTFLYLAAENQMSIVVEKLIDVGANIHVKNNKGATPLHFAVRQDDVMCVKLLLRHGANATAQDNYGYTPIDYAKAVKALDCLTVLEKFVHDNKLPRHGLYRDLSVEETETKRKHTLEKRASISIKNEWFGSARVY